MQAEKGNLESIVSHMAEVQYRNRRSVRSYVVTREYKLFGQTTAEKPDSQVQAQVSFLPPGTKQYAITRTEGSGRGEKVVRKILDHEQEMAGDWEDTAVTERNYTFQLAGEETLNGRRCYVLTLEPRRDSRDLVRGKAWIDAETYNPLQIVGQPAKSPSWWVKSVLVTLTFSEVDGMWLQSGAMADADVRLFGKHTLISRDVQYDTTETVAQRTQPRRGMQPQRAIGAAVMR